VEKEKYQSTASFVRGSYLAGNVLSSLGGQLLYSKLNVSLESLVYISCGVNIFCILMVLLFPSSKSNKLSSVLENFVKLSHEVFQTFKNFSIFQLSLWVQISLMIHHIVFFLEYLDYYTLC